MERSIEWRRYVGRPYVEPFGCFYLVREVLTDCGIVIPDYAEHLADTPHAKAAVFQAALAERCCEVGDPQTLDLILLRGGRSSHIGILTKPGEMLHASDGVDACIENYGAPRWRNRIEGFYRICQGVPAPAQN